jgi:hypothetical protein
MGTREVQQKAGILFFKEDHPSDIWGERGESAAAQLNVTDIFSGNMISLYFI